MSRISKNITYFNPFELCSNWQDFSRHSVARSLCDSWVSCYLREGRNVLPLLICFSVLLTINVNELSCTVFEKKAYLPATVTVE